MGHHFHHILSLSIESAKLVLVALAALSVTRTITLSDSIEPGLKLILL